MFFGIYRSPTADGFEKYRQTEAHATARDERQRRGPASRRAALPLPAHRPATSDQAASKPSQAALSSGLRSTPQDQVEAGDPPVTNEPSAVTAARDENESNAKARSETAVRVSGESSAGANRLRESMRAREVGQRLTTRLVGRPLPRVQLCDEDGGITECVTLYRGWVVLCLYPGSVDTGEQEVAADDALHVAIRRGTAELEACKSTQIMSLCNQSYQVRMAERHRFHVGYRMLGDPGMHLAAELDLPTKNGNGRELYERLVLVVCDGVIQRVLYPTSGRAVTQTLGWLTHER
jgi:peroxiredoxin